MLTAFNPPMRPQDLFEAHLPLVDTIIDRVCRRSRLSGAAAEDFASTVRLALIENDYALLRDAAQRSSMAAYLTVVIQRMAVDERFRTFGRWQPSAAARTMGNTGILAETLLVRDRRSMDEALPLLRDADPAMSRDRLQQIAAVLPQRTTRPRSVELDEASEHFASPDSADARAVAGDATRIAFRTSATVRTVLDSLPPEDQALIRFRFGSSMSIADISRILRLPQRPLYRRLQALLTSFRRALGDAGIAGADVEELIGSPAAEMRFGLEQGKNEEPQQSNSGEAL
jgi:RNA polymerase sigma factor for flagellar operon FliA